MNYRWCKGCANYLDMLGCVLGNEDVFDGDDYAVQHCQDRQEHDDENDKEA